MKTIIALALTAAFGTAANAATFVFVKPAPVACTGTACTIATAIKAPVAPIGGAPTAPVAPTPAPTAPTAPAPFNASLLVSQAAAVAKASGVCFHHSNIVETAEQLAVISTGDVLCLSANPTPQMGATSGGYAWSVVQNYTGRTWTQAFQIRTVNAQTGASTWSLKMVAGAPTSAEFRNYRTQWIASNGTNVYPDGAQYAAFNYTAILTGVSQEACVAVTASGNSQVTCAGGVVTAQHSAASFSNVGSSSGSVAYFPGWAASTVGYPQ